MVLQFFNFMEARTALLSGFFCWLSVGLIACGFFMNLGWWALGGFILIAASAVAEYVHIQAPWRKYLSAPYTNNHSMWITDESYATGSGLTVSRHANQHFFKLVNVARTSFSQDRLRRDFVRRTGNYYEKFALLVTIGMVLLGTAVTLR